MKVILYLLLPMFLFQNCFWTNLSSELIISPKEKKRQSVSVSIEFDYSNQESINIDLEHYNLSSMYIQSIRELNLFDRVSYADPKAEYFINIRTTLRSNPTDMLFYVLSAITLGIIPLYYNESMDLEVELINSITKNKSNIRIPLKINFISYIYATNHYHTISRKEIASDVVRRIISEGLQSKVFDFL
ncbi:hypothetical protein [Leptospira kirschneri]|uniref:hypothetical protein n=1 Tax=Leptospira kirschneri TaxID=29507 RepID=UPI000990B3B7|nr:hypothetical protein [Leptospira kirschneri]